MLKNIHRVLSQERDRVQICGTFYTTEVEICEDRVSNVGLSLWNRVIVFRLNLHRCTQTAGEEATVMYNKRLVL